MWFQLIMGVVSTLQEKYVKEVDPNKVNMLLVSKADLLTLEQRYGPELATVAQSLPL